MSDKSKIKEIKKLNKPHKSEEKKISNSDGNIIELKNVSKKYTTGGEMFEALTDINISIKKGSFVVIVGKSGSGKSTLLNIMSGLIRATTGEVIVNDNNLISFNNKELTNFRSRNCGFIFQQYGLLSTLTIEENIYTGLNLKLQNDSNKLTKEEKKEIRLHKKELKKQKINDHSKNENQEKYDNPKMYEIMKTIGIYDLKNKFPSQLSGGQQQRVSIARALIKEPKILFGDEPTGAVDSAMTLNILQLLKKINSEGTTVVLITHDPRLSNIADHVIEIKSGKIVNEYKQNPVKDYENLFI